MIDQSEHVGAMGGRKAANVGRTGALPNSWNRVPDMGFLAEQRRVMAESDQFRSAGYSCKWDKSSRVSSMKP